tara:strand:- start:728 stop:1285 length:558 start_codon:yes stop_codon:yes gene_type:complete
MDLLVALDLDLVHNYTDKDKAEIIMQKLDWWLVAPSPRTLIGWRRSEDYVKHRDEVLRNDELAGQVHHWASRLMHEKDLDAEGNARGGVVHGYEQLIRDGPAAHGRTWLDAARDVRKMAGLDTQTAVGAGAAAFLEGLGIGIGQEVAKVKIGLQRQDDGTIVEGEFSPVSPSQEEDEPHSQSQAE